MDFVFERVNLIKSDLAFIRFLSFKFALVMSKNKFHKWKSYVSKLNTPLPLAGYLTGKVATLDSLLISKIIYLFSSRSFDHFLVLKHMV